jgi:hypothetical protein
LFDTSKPLYDAVIVYVAGFKVNLNDA